MICIRNPVSAYRNFKLEMVLGVALSGGGITGIIAGMCAINAMRDTFGEERMSRVQYSTVSGGTIGNR